MEKRPFFRAATAGLGKYHTDGHSRIGVYRINPKFTYLSGILSLDILYLEGKSPLMSYIQVNFWDILPKASKSSAFWDMGVGVDEAGESGWHQSRSKLYLQCIHGGGGVTPK